MTTKKEYIEHPSSHDVLSEVHAKSMPAFTEVIYENGIKRWMLFFLNNELFKKILIIHPLENESQLLNLFTANDNNIHLRVRKDKTVSNGYTSWKDYIYDNQVISAGYINVVFDTSGRLIAAASFDTNDNIDGACHKRYYLSGKEVLDGNGEVDYYFDEDDSVLFEWFDGTLRIRATFGDLDKYTSMASFKTNHPEILPVFGANVEAYFSTKLPMIPSFTL